MFAVTMLTPAPGAPNIDVEALANNATTLPAIGKHLDLDRGCMGRAGALRAHVLASGARAESEPGCRAAAVAMRDHKCVLREGCAMRTCTRAGFPMGAAAGRAAKPRGAAAPWWARPDAAVVRPVVQPERGAATVEQPAEVPDLIRDALQRDRNVLNGLPAGWPGPA